MEKVTIVVPKEKLGGDRVMSQIKGKKFYLNAPDGSKIPVVKTRCYDWQKGYDVTEYHSGYVLIKSVHLIGKGKFQDKAQAFFDRLVKEVGADSVMKTIKDAPKLND